MTIGRRKGGHYGWLLLTVILFSTGCSEIFFYQTWHQPPASSYIEPGPKKTTNEETQNPFYKIDCLGGVTCFGPDEEKTSQRDNLIIKECLWKNVPYKNGKPGLMWLTFSRKGDGCWQIHTEPSEPSGKGPEKKPTK